MSNAATYEIIQGGDYVVQTNLTLTAALKLCRTFYWARPGAWKTQIRRKGAPCSEWISHS